jgi:PST family polysaccharide transporter
MTNRADALALTLDGAGLKRRTVRGAGVTALAQGAKFCLQLGAQIVLARLLDPAQFGLVAMVAPVLGLVLALNDAGLGQAIVQRADLTHRQLSAMFWINLAIGGGLVLLALFAAPLVALLYGEPRVLNVTLASASLIALSSLAIVPVALLNRQMRFTALAAIEVAGMMAGLVSGIVSAMLGAGYWSLVIMQAVNSALSTVMAWSTCHWWPNRPSREPGVGALTRFGFHVMGSNLATYLSSSADNVIVGAVNGKVALGLYDRSYNLVVRPIMQLMAPASRVAVPLLARLQDSPERYARAYVLMLQVTNVACVPGLIAAIVMADPLIALLLGPKWAGLAPVFAWIGSGGVASALSASTYWLFTTQNRAGEQMRWSSVVAVISVVAFAVGSVWGVVGVARVSALSFVFVQTPLLAWAATRRGPVTPALLRAGLQPLVMAGFVTAATALAWLHVAVGPRWLQLLVAFVGAYAAFLFTLWLQPAGRHLMDNARTMLSRQVLTT